MQICVININNMTKRSIFAFLLFAVLFMFISSCSENLFDDVDLDTKSDYKNPVRSDDEEDDTRTIPQTEILF